LDAAVLNLKTKQRIFYFAWLASYIAALQVLSPRFGRIKISIVAVLIGLSGLWVITRLNK